MDFGYRPADMIFVRPKVDVSELDLEIAGLRGELKGWKEGFDELAEVAKAQKMIAEKNALLRDMYRNTVKELVAQGHLNRDHVNSMLDAYEKRLPVEDQELLATPIIWNGKVVA